MAVPVRTVCVVAVISISMTRSVDSSDNTHSDFGHFIRQETPLLQKERMLDWGQNSGLCALELLSYFIDAERFAEIETLELIALMLTKE